MRWPVPGHAIWVSALQPVVRWGGTAGSSTVPAPICSAQDCIVLKLAQYNTGRHQPGGNSDLKKNPGNLRLRTASSTTWGKH